MNERKSRRSCGRDNGREFDWCVIRGVDVAPNYFRGKAPQQNSIKACRSDSQPEDSTQWHKLLENCEVVTLAGDQVIQLQIA